MIFSHCSQFVLYPLALLKNQGQQHKLHHLFLPHFSKTVSLNPSVLFQREREQTSFQNKPLTLVVLPT